MHYELTITNSIKVFCLKEKRKYIKVTVCASTNLILLLNLKFSETVRFTATIKSFLNGLPTGKQNTAQCYYRFKEANFLP